MARAKYSLVVEKFGESHPFTNIIIAEENHIKHLKPLFTRHNIPLPVDNSKNYLQTPTIMKESLEAAVQGETETIAMYNRFLSQNIPADVNAVFTRIRDTSKNHLHAFQKALNSL
jgi:rubrerythrin